MRLRFFYDHPGANGKASAGIDALRAHGAPTTRRKCRSNVHAVRSRKVRPLERKELEMKASRAS
jgi:hypothetical protein